MAADRLLRHFREASERTVEPGEAPLLPEAPSGDEGRRHADALSPPKKGSNAHALGPFRTV